MNILAISGSLRKQSYNTALLKNATKLAPEGCNIELITLENIPLYNGDDEEQQGVPKSIEQIKEKIKASDAIIICTPEYNNSIPGVLKNAIDWMTRPPVDIPKVFANRIVGLIGVTIGNMGTLNAQTAFLPLFRTLSMHPWFAKKLFISNAEKKFDAEGNLIDEKTKQKLKEYLEEYAKYIRDYEIKSR